MTPLNTLVAIPAFNESKSVAEVLRQTLAIHPDVLVIDDGSTDNTTGILAQFPVDVIRHARNRGYGVSLRDAFQYAINHRFDWLITMDCDAQHEPASIPRFLEVAMESGADVISGSRYLEPTSLATAQLTAPPDRVRINQTITDEINERLGDLLTTKLTDSFCGFKAYRVRSLKRLKPTIPGYAFPMQFWVQAAAQRLRIVELPVALIYNDLNRTFGVQLSDPQVRLNHYREVFNREICAQRQLLPASVLTKSCEQQRGMRVEH